MDIILGRQDLSQLLSLSKDPSKSYVTIIPRLQCIANTALYLIGQLSNTNEIDANECHIEDLTQTIRILRNFCAVGPSITDNVIAIDILAILHRTIQLIGNGYSGLNWTLPVAVSQCLSNCIGLNRSLAQQAHRRLFPIDLTILAHIDSSKTQSATALSLYSMCNTVPEFVIHVISPQGAPIIAAMLHANNRFAHRHEQNDTLGLLLCSLVFVHGALGPLFKSLSQIESKDVKTTVPPSTTMEYTAAHTYLLQELSLDLQEVPNHHHCSTKPASATQSYPITRHQPLSPSSCPQNSSMEYLLNDVILPLVTRDNDDTNSDNQPSMLSSNTSLSMKQQILQDAIHMVRDIMARDDDGLAFLINTKGFDTKEKEANNTPSLVRHLEDLGMVKLFLAMLKALGPIINPRRDVPNQPCAELAPLLKEGAAKLISKPPYHGYRSDILSGKMILYIGIDDSSIFLPLLIYLW